MDSNRNSLPPRPWPQNVGQKDDDERAQQNRMLNILREQAVMTAKHQLDLASNVQVVGSSTNGGDNGQPTVFYQLNSMPISTAHTSTNVNSGHIAVHYRPNLNSVSTAISPSNNHDTGQSSVHFRQNLMLPLAAAGTSVTGSNSGYIAAQYRPHMMSASTPTASSTRAGIGQLAIPNKLNSMPTLMSAQSANSSGFSQPAGYIPLDLMRDFKSNNLPKCKGCGQTVSNQWDHRDHPKCCKYLFAYWNQLKQAQPSLSADGQQAICSFKVNSPKVSTVGNRYGQSGAIRMPINPSAPSFTQSQTIFRPSLNPAVPPGTLAIPNDAAFVVSNYRLNAPSTASTVGNDYSQSGAIRMPINPASAPSFTQSQTICRPSLNPTVPSGTLAIPNDAAFVVSNYRLNAPSTASTVGNDYSQSGAIRMPINPASAPSFTQSQTICRPSLNPTVPSGTLAIPNGASLITSNYRLNAPSAALTVGNVLGQSNYRAQFVPSPPASKARAPTSVTEFGHPIYLPNSSLASGSLGIPSGLVQLASRCRQNNAHLSQQAVGNCYGRPGTNNQQSPISTSTMYSEFPSSGANSTLRSGAVAIPSEFALFESNYPQYTMQPLRPSSSASASDFGLPPINYQPFTTKSATSTFSSTGSYPSQVQANCPSTQQVLFTRMPQGPIPPNLPTNNTLFQYFPNERPQMVDKETTTRKRQKYGKAKKNTIQPKSAPAKRQLSEMTPNTSTESTELQVPSTKVAKTWSSERQVELTVWESAPVDFSAFPIVEEAIDLSINAKVVDMKIQKPTNSNFVDTQASTSFNNNFANLNDQSTTTQINRENSRQISLNAVTEAQLTICNQKQVSTKPILFLKSSSSPGALDAAQFKPPLRRSSVIKHSGSLCSGTASNATLGADEIKKYSVAQNSSQTHLTTTITKVYSPTSSAQSPSLSDRDNDQEQSTSSSPQLNIHSESSPESPEATNELVPQEKYCLTLPLSLETSNEGFQNAVNQTTEQFNSNDNDQFSTSSFNSSEVSQRLPIKKQMRSRNLPSTSRNEFVNFDEFDLNYGESSQYSDHENIRDVESQPNDNEPHLVVQPTLTRSRAILQKNATSIVFSGRKLVPQNPVERFQVPVASSKPKRKQAKKREVSNSQSNNSTNSLLAGTSNQLEATERRRKFFEWTLKINKLKIQKRNLNAAEPSLRPFILDENTKMHSCINCLDIVEFLFKPNDTTLDDESLPSGEFNLPTNAIHLLATEEDIRLADERVRAHEERLKTNLKIIIAKKKAQNRQQIVELNKELVTLQNVHPKTLEKHNTIKSLKKKIQAIKAIAGHEAETEYVPPRIEDRKKAMRANEMPRDNQPEMHHTNCEQCKETISSADDADVLYCPSCPRVYHDKCATRVFKIPKCIPAKSKRPKDQFLLFNPLPSGNIMQCSECYMVDFGLQFAELFGILSDGSSLESVKKAFHCVIISLITLNFKNEHKSNGCMWKMNWNETALPNGCQVDLETIWNKRENYRCTQELEMDIKMMIHNIKSIFKNSGHWNKQLQQIETNYPLELASLDRCDSCLIKYFACPHGKYCNGFSMCCYTPHAIVYYYFQNEWWPAKAFEYRPSGTFATETDKFEIIRFGDVDQGKGFEMRQIRTASQGLLRCYATNEPQEIPTGMKIPKRINQSDPLKLAHEQLNEFLSTLYHDFRFPNIPNEAQPFDYTKLYNQYYVPRYRFRTIEVATAEMKKELEDMAVRNRLPVDWKEQLETTGVVHPVDEFEPLDPIDNLQNPVPANDVQNPNQMEPLNHMKKQNKRHKRNEPHVNEIDHVSESDNDDDVAVDAAADAAVAVAVEDDECEYLGTFGWSC